MMLSNRWWTRTARTCGIGLMLCGPTAHAGSGVDHPLVGRYADSELVGETHSDFDEVGLITGPIAGPRTPGAPGWITLEGKSSLFYYALPAGRSTLEVLRNYEASLASKGFGVQFTCATSNGSCYSGRNNGTDPYAFANADDA